MSEKAADKDRKAEAKAADPKAVPDNARHADTQAADARPAPTPKAAKKAAEEADRERRADAKHVLAEYRKQFPGDKRTDEELTNLPNGAMEIADMDREHDAHRAEKMKRLWERHQAEDGA